jgi:hypothetical protein
MSVKHDVIFHVLYGENRCIMTQTITAMANRLYSMTESEQLQQTMSVFLQSWNTIPIVKMQALWIVLFNVDIPMKEYILDPANTNSFRLAMNITDPKVDIEKHPAVLMMRSLPLNRAKAIRFLTDLHDDGVPKWMQNEAINAADLVMTTKEIYLNA